MDLLPGEGLPGLVEGLAQRRGKLARRLPPRPEGLHYQPLTAITPQLRHDPGPDQRRLAAARGPQHHDQARMSLAPHAVEQLDALANLLVAAEEDRRVRLVEGAQTGIRRLVGLPLACLRRHDPLDLEAVPEPLVAVVLVRSQIDVLLLGEDRGHLRLLAPGIDLEDEEFLALHPGEGDLGEAPLGGEVAVAAQRDHGAAGAQLGVEGALPADAGLDARLRVEVEEDRAVALLLEPGLEFLGRSVVAAAVADEEVAHARCGRALPSHVGLRARVRPCPPRRQPALPVPNPSFHS